MKSYKPKSITQFLMTAVPRLGLSLLCLSSVACMKPEGRGRDERNGQDTNSATFLVDAATGVSKTMTLDSKSQLPISRLYNFSTCVRDRRTQDLIRGHTFVISRSDQQEKKIQSDAEGCLHWSEEKTFNFFADAVQIPLEFEVRADGMHSGVRRLRLAINPWADGTDTAIDLDRQDVPEDKLAIAADATDRLQGSGVVRPLWIEDLTFEHKRDSGVGSELVLTMVPKVWLKNLDGRSYTYALKAGAFKVTAKLISSIEKNGSRQKAILTSVPQDQNGSSIKDGSLVFRFNPRLEYLPNEGQVELVLQVGPTDGPKGLTDFEGVFIVGDADVLSGSRSLTLRSKESNHKEQDFHVQKSITGAVDLSRGETGSSGKQIAAGSSSATAGLISAAAFELTPLEGRPERIPVESSLRRKVSFRVKTCPTDPNQSGRRLRDMDFTVFSDTNAALPVRADVDGCIYWEDSIEHIYYEAERYFTRHYTIRSSRGAEQTRTLVINPWEADVWPFFAVDLKIFGEAKLREANALQRDPSRLLLPPVGLERARTRYAVDDFLGLQVKRAVLMILNPRVARHSVRRGMNVVEPLRKGIYLLQIALQREFREREDKANEFISVAKKLVRVEDGRIQTPVEFSFRDLRFLTMLSHLVIELAPIDESRIDTKTLRPKDSGVDLASLVVSDQGLAARTFLGPVVPNDKAAAVILRPVDDLDEAYCGTIDCDQLKNSEAIASAEVDPQTAKFYGSAKHLKDIRVSDLIERAQAIEAKYKERNREMVRLSRFAQAQNAEVVALSNGDNIVRHDAALASMNHSIDITNGGADLVQKLTSELPRQGFWRRSSQGSISLETIKGWIEGRAMSEADTTRLCVWWISEFARQAARSEKPVFFSDVRETAMRTCVQGAALAAAKKQGPFLLERKLRVLKTTDHDVASGAGMEFELAASYSVSASDSLSWSNSVSASPTALLQLLPSRIFTSIASAINWTFTRTSATDQSRSEGSTLNTGLILHMERADARLMLSEYERCAVLRLHPDFVQKFRLVQKLEPSLTDEQKAAALSRSLLICKGEVETKRIIVPENYYYFSSLISEDVLLDRNDPRNQPWLMALRGRADYHRFVSMLEARPKSASDVAKKVETGSKPIEQIRAPFQYATPTYPGIYTLIDGNEVVDASSSSQPSQ